MNHSQAEEYARLHGDAFYLYDEGRFVNNFQELLSAFRGFYPNTRIAYSYKTNYTPAICQRVDALGGYAEVVSAMEYALARRVGVRPEKIVYNGPWKSDKSMREALTAGSVVNLDSGRDLDLLLQMAAESPSTAMGVGIRCNFPIEGYPDSRFGFDVEGESFREAVAAIKRRSNVTLAGLHCHFPDRELRSFAERARRIVEIARRVFEDSPHFISVGGGFFGHLPESLRRRYSEGAPQFEDYARVVGQTFADAYGGASGSPVLFVEPGTALVADTFRFVARVIDVKQVRSRRLACVAGSLFNISPYARSQNLPIAVLRRSLCQEDTSSEDTYDVVGYTCIENDVLSRAVRGPLKIGDFVLFTNVGSYSIVMKPPFILPSVPIIMRSIEGTERVIKRAESVEYLFENFVF